MQNHEWLPFFIAAHLFGDFVLQNNWMAANKGRSSLACAVHVLAYLVPFYLLIVHHGAPFEIIVLIGIQHFLQDRFSLHLKWMSFYGQTKPDKWPVGPLCVDQAMHIWFMAVFCLL